MFPLVEEVLNRLDMFISDNQKDPLEAREVCAKFTTDVVSSCIFNADAQSFTKEKTEIREMGDRIFSLPTLKKFVNLLYSIVPSLRKLYNVKFIDKDVEDFFSNLMRQAVEQRDKDKIDRDDYLAYLINLRKKKNFQDIDMAAHGVTFFVDGFETSSLAISHALYELAANPNVQDKLRDEVNQMYESSGSLNYEKFMENDYLEQVFYESLRLHPIAGFVNRVCNEAIELTDSNGQLHQFEVDDNVNILVHSMHRDAEYFENPEKFNPERFNLENGGIKASRDLGVFHPFGEGPRIVRNKTLRYLNLI